jgi:outer membrane protein
MIRAKAGGEGSAVRSSAVAHSGIRAFALMLALLPAWAPAQSGAGKIGYVDLKRLLDNAPQMVDSRAKLQQEFAGRDNALKADEAKLASLQQKYDRDASIMSKPDAETLKRDIDTLDRANKRTREALRTELNTRATAERDRLWTQINDTVIEYARAQGFDLIVPSPVVYASARIDITDAVLDKLRQPKPAAGAKP